MTDTTITDAVVFPQDDGTGVADGSEDYNSAGYFGLLSAWAGGTYRANGVRFSNIVTTDGSESVDLTAGHLYITTSGATVQSGSQTAYDTTLPSGSDMPYVVVLPTAVSGLSLDTDTSNAVWIAVDETANDSVYVRHGSGLSVPTDPSIRLGNVDSTDGSVEYWNDSSLATPTSSHIQHFSYESGLGDEEIGRILVGSGERLDVYRLGLAVKGGGTDANVTLELYDTGDASVIDSVTGGQVKFGTPLASSTAGSDIIARLTNTNDVAVTVAPHWEADIV